MHRLLVALVLALGAAAVASAQPAPLQQFEEDLSVDSGPLRNDGADRARIWSTIVHVPDAAWVRLRFGPATQLGQHPRGGERTTLRVIGLRDGVVQRLWQIHLDQWNDTSAYFNGDTVALELIADPGAAPSRVVIDGAWGGTKPADALVQTICGPTDDRVLSDVPRVGRVMPIGCTGWIIDDANRCLLTAGHCTGASMTTMEFNVPLSSAGGNYQHPSPDHQYAIDPVSIQENSGSPSVGDDWAYYGCFPNSNTGLTPFQAQGEFFVLDHAPSVTGQMLDVTGYGTTSSPVPPQWNGVQKSHVGPITTLSGTQLGYAVDTTGGNSGSPVLDLSTGKAIAVHTNGGCSSGGGANLGTALNNADLIFAIQHPLGVCQPLDLLTFFYPGGVPSQLAESGATIDVLVFGQNGGTPEPGSGVLHLDRGNGFETVAMTETKDNVYVASFPDLLCGSTVRYYFSAETLGGDVETDPVIAPVEVYTAVVAETITTAFMDDFETDLGWSVTDDDAITDGTWDRGVPVGGGDRGDPPTDADGSGQCYLTDNVDGNSDVDGGTTTLTSPALDASDPGSVLVFDRWFSNDSGAGPDEDVFIVEVSDDDGASWVPLETVGPNDEGSEGGWIHREIPVASMSGVVPSAIFRVRFVAADLGAGSVVEAGIDGVAIVVYDCGAECPEADIDGDCLVGFSDLVQLLGAWGDCPKGGGACPSDLDGDGMTGFSDLLLLLGSWS